MEKAGSLVCVTLQRGKQGPGFTGSHNLSYFNIGLSASYVVVASAAFLPVGASFRYA
jgi:hypothetical protein